MSIIWAKKMKTKTSKSAQETIISYAEEAALNLLYRGEGSLETVLYVSSSNIKLKQSLRLI
jgi:hypothetical protein